MAMTAGRSVDLIGAAQREAPERVWRELLHYTGPRQKQTPVHREPEWTPEDAALACAGLEDKFYAAFAFRYAGDDAVRPILWAALMLWTEATARREGWRLEVEGIKALRGMVDLAVLTEYLTVRQPGALADIRDKDLWHAYFGASVQMLARIGDAPRKEGPPPPRIGITVAAWERDVAGPYKVVQTTIDRWCSIAYGYASRRIRDDDECA
jgi:hypothetical protein